MSAPMVVPVDINSQGFVIGFEQKAHVDVANV